MGKSLVISKSVCLIFRSIRIRSYFMRRFKKLFWYISIKIMLVFGSRDSSTRGLKRSKYRQKASGPYDSKVSSLNCINVHPLPMNSYLRHVKSLTVTAHAEMSFCLWPEKVSHFRHHWQSYEFMTNRPSFVMQQNDHSIATSSKVYVLIIL